jgi:alternate signal-mediated exported protein
MAGPDHLLDHCVTSRDATVFTGAVNSTSATPGTFPRSETQPPMNHTLKGSFAALAAATLLLGGVGSLAYWNDSEELPGASVTSGRLQLGTPDCGAGWLLDGGAPFTNQLIVPGDTLTKVCTIDLVATGDHLGADLAVGTPAWAAANHLTEELAPSATFTVNGETATHIRSADDTGTGEIRATITVGFDHKTATNSSQDLSAVLQAVAVTATQTHDAS